MVNDPTRSFYLNNELLDIANPGVFYVDIHTSDQDTAGTTPSALGAVGGRFPIQFITVNEATKNGDINQSHDPTGVPAFDILLAWKSMSIWDAQSGGNMLYFINLVSTTNIPPNEAFVLSQVDLTEFPDESLPAPSTHAIILTTTLPDLENMVWNSARDYLQIYQRTGAGAGTQHNYEIATNTIPTTDTSRDVHDLHLEPTYRTGPLTSQAFEHHIILATSFNTEEIKFFDVNTFNTSGPYSYDITGSSGAGSCVWVPGSTGTLPPPSGGHGYVVWSGINPNADLIKTLDPDSQAEVTLGNEGSTTLRGRVHYDHQEDLVMFFSAGDLIQYDGFGTSWTVQDSTGDALDVATGGHITLPSPAYQSSNGNALSFVGYGNSTSGTSKIASYDPYYGFQDTYTIAGTSMIIGMTYHTTWKLMFALAVDTWASGTANFTWYIWNPADSPFVPTTVSAGSISTFPGDIAPRFFNCAAAASSRLEVWGLKPSTANDSEIIKLT